MAIQPFLLEQVLRAADEKDVRGSPIVTAIILQDPANAADLVPYLEETGSVASTNARRILCLFEASAVPHIVAALANREPAARMEGLEILWTLLASEPSHVVRDTLEQISNGLELFLGDKRPAPVELPPHIERDFLGRICDQAFLIVSELIDPEFDESRFRSLDESGRDHAIAQLRRGDFGRGLV
jgi:hypothetical protein